jgi:hypothetical protein
MNASTISQSASASSGVAGRTLARAREAILRAATGVVSSIEAIESKSTPKLSCSTKATRSAGVRRSSTTCNAMPTVSASTTSSAGSIADASTSIDSVGTGVRARSRSKHSREVTVVS